MEVAGGLAGGSGVSVGTAVSVGVVVGSGITVGAAVPVGVADGGGVLDGSGAGVEVTVAVSVGAIAAWIAGWNVDAMKAESTFTSS